MDSRQQRSPKWARAAAASRNGGLDAARARAGIDVHKPHDHCEPSVCIEVDASDPAQADCPKREAA